MSKKLTLVSSKVSDLCTEEVVSPPEVDVNFCPCDARLVYANTAEQGIVIANEALGRAMCSECYHVRCDAYPGACRGLSYY